MSGTKIELLIHPMCPFAERAFLTFYFKSIPGEVIEVSLAHPPADFLELNPKGEVPSCRVTRDGQVFKLTESLNISEFFDSFPGRSLYPKTPEGTTDAVLKCLIDVFIKLDVSKFIDAYYTLYSPASEESINELSNAVTEINGKLEGGNYVLNKLVGRNELSFADVMLFPHVERLFKNWELVPEPVKAVEHSGLRAWYEKIAAEPWVSPHLVAGSRYVNSLKKVHEAGYNGLELPLTHYD